VAVEAVVGDQTARKRRILEAERDITEVLLIGELADGSDRRVIDLDFVGRVRRRSWRGHECRPSQRDERMARHAFEGLLRHRGNLVTRHR
jgi:hypothetical protein